MSFVEYRVTPPTLTDQTGCRPQSDAKGSLKVVQADSSGNPVGSGPAQIFEAHNYLNINANGNYSVKAGNGVLHRISVNTKGSADTITIYDNTAISGTKIGTIDGSSDRDHWYGVTFAIGLSIAVAGTTAPDITVVFD